MSSSSYDLVGFNASHFFSLFLSFLRLVIRNVFFSVLIFSVLFLIAHLDYQATDCPEEMSHGFKSS